MIDKRSNWYERAKRLVLDRTISIALCGTVALVVAAMFSAVRLPVPCVHDEFSYLLAADTFAEGRLANQPHGLWQHFESFHVIQQPSYASKYQPGQGLMLALGTLVGGHPIVGAWIASALAASAVCWMLQGWMPSRWALLGGLLVAMHGMIVVRWSLSYWGGSLPMFGGALMFGALQRTFRNPRMSTSIIMACGALVLGATRPFEGLIVGVSVAVALLVWMVRSQQADWLTVAADVVIPSAVVLWFGLAAFGYYNYRVTGDPLLMPYQVHEAEYGYSPLFLWKAPQQPPEYRHDVMQAFQTGWAIEDYHEQQSLVGWALAKFESLTNLWRFFLGGALAIPLVMLRPLLRDERLRFAWLALLVFVVAELTVPWSYPHYFAPAVPLLFLIIVQGMRHLAALPRQGHAWAKLAVPAILLLHFSAVPSLFAQYRDWQPEGWQWQRERIATQLRSLPGEHLVLVEYGPDHNGHHEWVYNRANLAKAKIVWARQISAEEDATLRRHFHDRQAWIVKADADYPELIALETNQDGEIVSQAVWSPSE